jgi:hypothetical protein
MLLQTVVETPEFIKQSKICMTDKARNEFIDFIAKNPLAGDVIPGAGEKIYQRRKSRLYIK